MPIKKIFLISFIIASLLIVPAKVFGVSAPSLLQTTSVLTWNEAGQEKKVNETAWYYLRSNDQSSTLKRLDKHPSLTAKVGCVKNGSIQVPILQPDSSNPDQKEFYQLIASSGRPDKRLKYGVVEATWDNGQQNNCEYGYLYYFGANNPTFVEINGDVYAAGDIEGEYDVDKNYILFAGRHNLVESSAELVKMDTSNYDGVTKVGMYQLGSATDEYQKNIALFVNQLTSLKNSSSRVQSGTSNTFTNENDLMRELRKETIPTTYPHGEVYVYQHPSNKLKINQNINLQSTANKLVIVTSGNIEITSNITGSGNLVLVAENGNMTVSNNGTNDVKTLNAALISLNKDKAITIADFFQTNALPLDIKGLLVGSKIDFLRDPAKLKAGNNAAVVLTYNPNLVKVPGFMKLIKPTVDEATP